MAGFAIELDRAVMLVDDALYDRESQTTTLMKMTNHGLKNGSV